MFKRTILNLVSWLKNARLRLPKNKKLVKLEGAVFWGLRSSISLNAKGTNNKRQLTIGDDCSIYGHIKIQGAGNITIGHRVQIGPNTLIGAIELITIDDYALLANNISVVDNNNHSINPADRLLMNKSLRGSPLRGWIYSKSAPIHIGKNVWIGQNSRICKGVTIGENSIVAANSVVTKSVPKNSIVAGNPARVVKEGIDLTERMIKKNAIPNK